LFLIEDIVFSCRDYIEVIDESIDLSQEENPVIGPHFGTFSLNSLMKVLFLVFLWVLTCVYPGFCGKWGFLFLDLALG
jgi:hypothetical protein